MKNTTLGYMNLQGGVTDSTSLCYMQKIPVNTGDIIRCYGFHDNQFISQKMRFVTAFDSSGKALGDDKGASETKVYTVPDGVAYVIITVYKAYTAEITINEEVTEYTPYFEPYYKALPEFVGVASESSFGLVKVWTTVVDGETILNISTEE